MTFPATANFTNTKNVTIVSLSAPSLTAENGIHWSLRVTCFGKTFDGDIITLEIDTDKKIVKHAFAGSHDSKALLESLTAKQQQAFHDEISAYTKFCNRVVSSIIEGGLLTPADDMVEVVIEPL